jgi:SAM-dependent methyltransferase
MAAPTDHPHSPLRLRCIDELRLDPGDTVLDAGCGTGLAFEPLFERIGRRGRLIAFEQDPALHAQAEMRAQGLRAQGWQVEVLCARAQEVQLPARPDAALFHDVHDIIGTPAAVAHLFAQFPAGMRIAFAGGRSFPWWRLLPTLLARWLARRRASAPCAAAASVGAGRTPSAKFQVQADAGRQVLHRVGTRERSRTMTLARNPDAAPSAAPGGLAAHYRHVRAASLALAAPLSDEDCQVQSMPDASPTKWHLAHITWFFETFVLERHEAGFRPFDPAFRVLFNSYYQGVGEQHPRPQRGLITRPALAEVQALPRAVDERMAALLARAATTPRSPRWSAGPAPRAAAPGADPHRHQARAVVQPARRRYARRWPIGAVRPQPLRWSRYDGGLVELGHDRGATATFCFDNETPRHRASRAVRARVAARELRRVPRLHRRRRLPPARAVAVDGLGLGAGGARERAALLAARRRRRWLSHTLQGAVEIDPHTPVCHLSYFEADAFARWAGARLPTEAEWEHAARPRAACRRTSNFADRGAFTRCRADAGDDEPVQMFGDVWEWTQSTYTPTPATGRCRARSASTTASSCATSSCCAAARARRRPATCARATATSFRPTRSGSSAGCACAGMRRGERSPPPPCHPGESGPIGTARRVGPGFRREDTRNTHERHLAFSPSARPTRTRACTGCRSTHGRDHDRPAARRTSPSRRTRSSRRAAVVEGLGREADARAGLVGEGRRGSLRSGPARRTARPRADPISRRRRCTGASTR